MAPVAPSDSVAPASTPPTTVTMGGQSLRKFTLHPASLTASTSVLMQISSSSSSSIPPVSQLNALRSILIASQSSANERLSLKDFNLKLLSERPASKSKGNESSISNNDGSYNKQDGFSAAATGYSANAKRKSSLLDQDEIEGDPEEQHEQGGLVIKVKTEEDEEGDSDARRRRDTVLSGEGQQRLAESQASNVSASHTDNAEKLTSSAVDTIAEAQSVSARSSAEAEDDAIGQFKPPMRSKSSDHKKKRKRDQIVDSDDASVSSDIEDGQPLLQKLRKLENGAATPSGIVPSPSPAPPPSSPSKADITQVPPLGDSMLPPSPPFKDPFDGMSYLERKLQEEKFTKHSVLPPKPPAPGTATAFYLPSQPLVPARVTSSSILTQPTPKKQSEVSEDFTKQKAVGSQIAHHTFHSWVDSYLRLFGEDDLAFLATLNSLSSNPHLNNHTHANSINNNNTVLQDLTPYLIPPLGKYYMDRWEEEDSHETIKGGNGNGSGAMGGHQLTPNPLEPPVLPRYKPDALNEDTLGMENVFLGPLSERLISALAFEEPEGSRNGNESELDHSGIQALLGDRLEKDDNDMSFLYSKPLDAVDLEERIKKELRFIGVLGEEEVDWSKREDDEVSSALRACQRVLHRQVQVNEARKGVLSSLVKDRMGYQEYEAIRDAQERVIENGWTKRQRAGKKKGKGKERGDKKDEVVRNKPPVSLALLSAVEKRQKLVAQFKPFFEEEEDKGRFFGIPQVSVYQGLVTEGSTSTELENS